MKVEVSARAMVANGKTKALITLAPRWPSASKIHVWGRSKHYTNHRQPSHVKTVGALKELQVTWPLDMENIFLVSISFSVLDRFCVFQSTNLSNWKPGSYHPWRYFLKLQVLPGVCQFCPVAVGFGTGGSAACPGISAACPEQSLAENL